VFGKTVVSVRHGLNTVIGFLLRYGLLAFLWTIMFMFLAYCGEIARTAKEPLTQSQVQATGATLTNGSAPPQTESLAKAFAVYFFTQYVWLVFLASFLVDCVIDIVVDRGERTFVDKIRWCSFGFLVFLSCACWSLAIYRVLSYEVAVALIIITSTVAKAFWLYRHKSEPKVFL
jgi:hypothetical protein